MPIKIPGALPATETLRSENIFVMTESRAVTQDIRPLHIALLNLMPTKVVTETQLARLLGNTPLQVELTLLHTLSHKAANTPQEHLLAFYKTFEEVRNQKFDGLVITGAPVEQLPFEEVDYWEELCRIMEWSKTNVTSTLHICWGSQAGLYYHYGIPKILLAEKLFGVYSHRRESCDSMLLRGFDDVFLAPHSRYATVRRADVEAVSQLHILASSEKAGIYAIENDRGSQIFIFGHSEYDGNTLNTEYLRDKNAGLPIQIPENYFPDDDDTRKPPISWRAHAHLLFSNWLNYYVYQTTPYNIEQIGADKK